MDPILVGSYQVRLDDDVGTIQSQIANQLEHFLNHKTDAAKATKLIEQLLRLNNQLKKEKQEVIEPLLAQFAFAIDNRLTAEKAETPEYKIALQNLSGQIELIGALNGFNLLPPKSALPDPRRSTDYTRIPCPSPETDSRVRFIEKNGEAVVRTVLFQQQQDYLRDLKVAVELPRPFLSQDEAFCQVTGTTMVKTALHADHLQAASSLMARQKRLVETLSSDSRIFSDFQKRFPEECQRYFMKVRDSDGVNSIVGTVAFYREYYNAIGNLSLMLGYDNVCKSAKDWRTIMLETSGFGQDFLDSVEPIDQTGLILTSRDGIPLAQTLISWSEAHLQPRIHYGLLLRQFTTVAESLQMDIHTLPETHQKDALLKISAAIKTLHDFKETVLPRAAASSASAHNSNSPPPTDLLTKPAKTSRLFGARESSFERRRSHLETASDDENSDTDEKQMHKGAAKARKTRTSSERDEPQETRRPNPIARSRR